MSEINDLQAANQELLAQNHRLRRQNEALITANRQLKANNFDFIKQLADQTLPKYTNALAFLNNLPVNLNHAGIYLLIGHDKRNGQWLLKLGRTEALGKRQVLYSAQTDQHFAYQSLVTTIDFLDLEKTFNAAEPHFKSRLASFEALFRRVFLYYFGVCDAQHHLHATYGHEWFNAQNATRRKQMIVLFEQIANQAPNLAILREIHIIPQTISSLMAQHPNELLAALHLPETINQLQLDA